MNSGNRQPRSPIVAAAQKAKFHPIPSLAPWPRLFEVTGMMRFSACYVAEYLAESGESESPDVGDDWSDSDSGSKLWNAATVEFLLLRDFR